MPDPAEQQAAIAHLLAELAAQRLNPTPIPPQPAQADTLDQALVQMADVMAEMYPDHRS